MVYITSWQEYQDAAEALYLKSPTTTRYCVKWKSTEAKLVLKITDNVTCLKFKTYSSIFLNRFEALNLSLMQKMQNRQRPQPATTETPIPATEVLESTIQSPSVQGGGVKKKKPKKKK